MCKKKQICVKDFLSRKSSSDIPHPRVLLTNVQMNTKHCSMKYISPVRQALVVDILNYPLIVHPDYIVSDVVEYQLHMSPNTKKTSSEKEEKRTECVLHTDDHSPMDQVEQLTFVEHHSCSTGLLLRSQ